MALLLKAEREGGSLMSFSKKSSADHLVDAVVNVSG